MLFDVRIGQRIVTGIVVEDAIHNTLRMQELSVHKEVEKCNTTNAYELVLSSVQHPSVLSCPLLSNIVIYFFQRLVLKSFVGLILSDL